MEKKQRNKLRERLLTYSEMDIRDLGLDKVKTTLASAGVGYTDFQLDAHPGQPEQTQFVQMLSNTEWLLIYFTVNFLRCPDCQFQLKMAFKRACKLKLKSIIVLMPNYLLALLPAELHSMPKFIITKIGWHKGILAILQQKPMQLENDACDNLNHVHLSDYGILTDTALSEPERIVSDDDCQFFPKFSLKTVFSRIRWLRSLGQEKPDNEDIYRAIQKAKKRNWFWRCFNHRITPHEDPCVCYIKFVCFAEVLVLIWVCCFCFYRMKDEMLIPIYETKMVLCVFVFFVLMNLLLFRSCSPVFMKIKRFSLACTIYKFEILRVVMFSLLYTDATSMWSLDEESFDDIMHDQYELLPFPFSTTLSSQQNVVRSILTMLLFKSCATICSFSAFLWLPCLSAKYSYANLLRMAVLLLVLSIACSRAIYFLEMTGFLVPWLIIWCTAVLVNELAFLYHILKLVNACFKNDTHPSLVSHCLQEWSRCSVVCGLIVMFSALCTAYVFFSLHVADNVDVYFNFMFYIYITVLKY